VYETEDNGDTSGFYKFVPHKYGSLQDGGDLYMAKVVGVNQADLRPCRPWAPPGTSSG
jgi:hypothetical protein